MLSRSKKLKTMIGIRFSMQSENAAPSITINSPGAGLKADSDDSILFSIEVTDFDGDTIEYEIRSSKDGVLKSQTVTGGTELITLSKKLSPGDHNITIRVSDGQSNATKTFSLSISEAPDEGGEEEFMMWVIVIIVIIVVVIVALLFIRKRRRSGEEIPPPIEEYPAEEGEGDEAFDEYGEFKSSEEEAPKDEAAAPETPPPAPPTPPPESS